MRFFVPPRATGRARLHPSLAIALAVAALHGANDAYAAFLHPLLPRIMDKLELSIADAAVLTATLGIAASLAQPVLGHLSDRKGRRLMIVLGPIVSGVFLSMIGLAPSFGILLGLLVLGGLGGAAFHPPAVALAARVTEGKGSGMRHAVFSFGGAVGYAAGPLIAVGLVMGVGLEGLWMAAIPVLLLGGALYRILPNALPETDPDAAPTLGVLALLAGPLGLLFGISAVSAFIQRLFLTMEPIVMAEAGRSEVTGAVALSLYLGAQALGTLSGGYLTDRVDRRQLLVGLTLLAFPAHFLAFWFPAGSAASLLFAIVAGFLNMAVLPPIVVIAQEIAPGRAGRNSGIVMGLAWATGSIAMLAAGAMGNVLGARAAALVASPLALLGTVFALGGGLDRHRRPPETTRSSS
ncbi:MAG: MFS transporter [Chloroflexi bacterium]|nr:MFS transporter [Chloroflexota bacterium]